MKEFSLTLTSGSRGMQSVSDHAVLLVGNIINSTKTDYKSDSQTQIWESEFKFDKDAVVQRYCPNRNGYYATMLYKSKVVYAPISDEEGKRNEEKIGLIKY